ncbi:four and a half LIM domains protein 3b [Danio aesculapii]|uniref:four and a half LIM domains protein 3b n=1 Tax=Danio aesculapii TaxID=1142201 RepID=UPI0024BF281C|nr:four and a half LIM domains protein 3b [Danio aesculapii]
MSEPFDCESCKESLYGQKYIQVDDVPHCVPCYDRLHANTCHECKELIEHNSRELYHENRHYHEQCFRCSRCSRSLAEESFTCQEDALVCNECYCNEFSSNCVACGKTVMPGSKRLEYEGCVWHEECFVCCGCEQPIGAQSFIPDKDEYYCVPCYEGRFAPRCAHCKQTLVQGGVTYRDEPWHKECFLCTGCKVQLAGQPFTTQGEDPYCVKCFSNLYAQKCAACEKPITGFGEGKYVSFEERQWHKLCFKCSVCSLSLVGAGFFPHGSMILCKGCNTKKLFQIVCEQTIE